MSPESLEALHGLISSLEAKPLSMGNGDLERDAVVRSLREVVERKRELVLSDLFIAVKVLGADGQRIVSEAFGVIVASEASAIGLRPYPLAAGDDPADKLIQRLVALELPLAEARARLETVERLQEFLDNQSSRLCAGDLIGASALLGDDGYALVELFLRQLVMGTLSQAATQLWEKVCAHFGLNCDLSALLAECVVFPKSHGARSRQMMNLLPHIRAACTAVESMRSGYENTDIDEVVGRVGDKLDFLGEERLAGELELSLSIWSDFRGHFER